MQGVTVTVLGADIRVTVLVQTDLEAAQAPSSEEE